MTRILIQKNGDYVDRGTEVIDTEALSPITVARPSFSLTQGHTILTGSCSRGFKRYSKQQMKSPSPKEPQTIAQPSAFIQQWQNTVMATEDPYVPYYNSSPMRDQIKL